MKIKNTPIILTFLITFLFALSHDLQGHNNEKFELQQKYDFASQNSSDINEHVPTLHRYAKECSSVVELGVRSMVSTWGILKGLSESTSDHPSYVGVDIDLPPYGTLALARNLAEANGINFTFIHANDMDIEIDPTDMLFIDSLHTYCHLTYELETFSPKVNKYIAIHDTTFSNETIDGPGYEGDYSEYPSEYDRTKRGLWPAIVDFLERHPEWVLFERYYNNYGLTILKRF